ncbi:hypothetical protein ACIG5E_10100 [Kitasatospora sp. NPDC053057]
MPERSAAARHQLIPQPAAPVQDLTAPRARATGLPATRTAARVAALSR